MKNIETLVRLHKWRIDESARKLADLDALAVQFRERIVDLDAGLAAEAAHAGESIEAAAGYSRFLAAEVERRRKLEGSLAELAHEIDAARARLAAAYGELKTYEITLERRRAEAKRRTDRRQQAVLDEIGQILHRARAVGHVA